MTSPLAVNDTATTTQGVAVVISVLTNDYDADGDTLTIQSFTQGASGSVSNNGNGTLTYAPNNGFSGADSFSYTITDGQGGTNSASVSVSVAAAGGTPYWTNLVVATEAFIRGGVNAATDPDEVGHELYHGEIQLTVARQLPQGLFPVRPCRAERGRQHAGRLHHRLPEIPTSKTSSFGR